MMKYRDSIELTNISNLTLNPLHFLYRNQSDTKLTGHGDE